MRFGAIANSARGGGLRGPPPWEIGLTFYRTVVSFDIYYKEDLVLKIWTKSPNNL